MKGFWNLALLGVQTALEFLGLGFFAVGIWIMVVFSAAVWDMLLWMGAAFLTMGLACLLIHIRARLERKKYIQNEQERAA